MIQPLTQYLQSKVHLRAKVMDVTSRLTGCAGQAADAISVYSQVKMEDAPLLFKKSKVRMSRYLDTSTIPQMAKIMVQHGRPSRSSWAKSGRSSSGRTIMGKENSRKFYQHTVGNKFQIGNAYSFTEKQRLFLSVYVDDLKLAGKIQDIDPMRKVLMKAVDLGEPTSFPDHVYCFALNENVKQAKLLSTVLEISLNSTSLLELRKSYLILKKMAQTFPHGLMIWNVLQRKAWNDIANWRTKQLNNCTKSQVHALTTTNSRIKKWDLLEIGQRFAHKLIFKMPIFGAHWWAWYFNGPWTNLHVLSLSGLEHATNAKDLWSRTSITLVNSNSIVMWETKHDNADWDCFRTLILPEIQKTQNQHQEDSCAYSEVIRSCSKSWMCKKQTSVSHGSTEAEMIFSWCRITHGWNTSSRSLGFGNWSVSFLSKPIKETKDQVPGDSSRNTTSNKHTQNQTKIPTHHDNLELSNVDSVSSNAKSSQFGAMLYIFWRQRSSD